MRDRAEISEQNPNKWSQEQCSRIIDNQCSMTFSFTGFKKDRYPQFKEVKDSILEHVKWTYKLAKEICFFFSETLLWVFVTLMVY